MKDLKWILVQYTHINVFADTLLQAGDNFLHHPPSLSPLTTISHMMCFQQALSQGPNVHGTFDISF